MDASHPLDGMGNSGPGELDAGAREGCRMLAMTACSAGGHIASGHCFQEVRPVEAEDRPGSGGRGWSVERGHERATVSKSGRAEDAFDFSSSQNSQIRK